MGNIIIGHSLLLMPMPVMNIGHVIVLMFLGRVGPHALGTALALRERERRFRYAEERPIIG